MARQEAVPFFGLDSPSQGCFRAQLPELFRLRQCRSDLVVGYMGATFGRQMAGWVRNRSAKLLLGSGRAELELAPVTARVDSGAPPWQQGSRYDKAGELPGLAGAEVVGGWCSGWSKVWNTVASRSTSISPAKAAFGWRANHRRRRISTYGLARNQSAATAFPAREARQQSESRPARAAGVCSSHRLPGTIWQWQFFGRRAWNGWSCGRAGHRGPLGKLLPWPLTDGTVSYKLSQWLRPHLVCLMARSWWSGGFPGC